MDDRRNEQRRRALKGAAVWFNDRASTVDVVVRDLSENGCRIKSDAYAWLPKNFELSLGNGAIIEKAEVTWRRDGEVGVRFVSADASPQTASEHA
ncbi:MAG: PilZ domain-containing protein [Maricaulaceae bacterium]|jgi:hypothetical protein